MSVVSRQIQQNISKEPMTMDEEDPEFESLSGFEDEEKPSRKRKRPKDKKYDMIKSALETHLVEYARKKHTQKRDTELLKGTIEEYLSSFVLLGYNYDGDPVQLVSASTQQQSDSLGTLLQKFIISQSPHTPPGY